MINYNQFAWDADFPSVYGNTSISFLKNCPGFLEAKSGDMRAALVVVTKCINPYVVAEIRQKYKGAILIPVVTKNKLPEALAKMIGMDTYAGVCETQTLSRKSLSAMERLLHKPIFEGDIVKNKSYIIVDDIVTQGGTVAALRKYIIANGGTVAAIVTLSCSVDSKILAPSFRDIFNLGNRFGLSKITHIIRYYKIAYDLGELTRPQIKYLLRFKELDGLINKIERTQGALTAYTKEFSKIPV